MCGESIPRYGGPPKEISVPCLPPRVDSPAMRTTYEAPTVYSRHTWKMLAGVRMPFGIPIH